MEKEGKIKSTRVAGLVIMLVGVVFSFLIFGVCEIMSRLSSQTINVPSKVIAIPPALFAVGLVFLIGGDKAKQTIAIQDKSKLTMVQIVFYSSIVVPSFAYFFLLEKFFESIGYR